jgi:hypothetical protein
MPPLPISIVFGRLCLSPDAHQITARKWHRLFISSMDMRDASFCFNAGQLVVGRSGRAMSAWLAPERQHVVLK